METLKRILLLLALAFALVAVGRAEPVANAVEARKVTRRGYGQAELVAVLKKVTEAAERGADSASLWSGTGDPIVSEGMERELKRLGFGVQRGSLTSGCSASCYFVEISWGKP